MSARVVGWSAAGLVAGFAVLGSMLAPVLVAVGHVVVVIVAHAWAALPWVVLLEAAVAVSVALDWHEARIGAKSRKHAWLIGHVTVWVRAGRRARWVWRVAMTVVKQLRKPAVAAVAVDVAVPVGAPVPQPAAAAEKREGVAA